MFLAVSPLRPSAIIPASDSLKIFTPLDVQQVADLLSVSGVCEHVLAGPFVPDPEFDNALVSQSDDTDAFRVRIKPAPTVGSIVSITVPAVPIFSFASGSLAIVW